MAETTGSAVDGGTGLNPRHYARVSHTFIYYHEEPYGQSLIVHEIVALLLTYNCRSLWLPYENCETLRRIAMVYGINVWADRNEKPVQEECKIVLPSVDCEAMYLGTPTIADGEALGAGKPQWWTVEAERRTVQTLCKSFAGMPSSKLIVTGLGGGDITANQRASDMGGGYVVAYKHFREFEDWVFAREV